MGGGYYDREVFEQSYNCGYSNQANQLISSNKKGHSSLNPKRWEDEVLLNNNKNPIVFALDDTGSMGDWTKVNIMN